MHGGGGEGGEVFRILKKTYFFQRLKRLLCIVFCFYKLCPLGSSIKDHRWCIFWILSSDVLWWQQVYVLFLNIWFDLSHLYFSYLYLSYLYLSYLYLPYLYFSYLYFSYLYLPYLYFSYLYFSYLYFFYLYFSASTIHICIPKRRKALLSSFVSPLVMKASLAICICLFFFKILTILRAVTSQWVRERVSIVFIFRRSPSHLPSLRAWFNGICNGIC